MLLLHLGFRQVEYLQEVCLVHSQVPMLVK
jgi:hypothetical protein